MAVDPEFARMLARATARVSGVFYAWALFGYGRDVLRHRKLDRVRGRFTVVMVAQAVHFSAVLQVAYVTAGASIREAGGWTLVLTIAAVFFASVWLIGETHGVPRRPLPLGVHWLARGMATLIWLIFTLGFYGRGRAFYPDLALAAVVAAGGFVYFWSWRVPTERWLPK